MRAELGVDLDGGLFWAVGHVVGMPGSDLIAFRANHVGRLECSLGFLGVRVVCVRACAELAGGSPGGSGGCPAEAFGGGVVVA